MKYELPMIVDHCLASVSKLYAREGNRELQQLVVNAQTRLHEAWTSDNWNGGTFGHALYLVVPEELYLAAVSRRTDIQNKIRDDLNKVHNVANEFYAEVFLEMEAIGDQDWRQESGLVVSGRRPVNATTIRRIWDSPGFRLFLSHRSSVKKETTQLKEQLRLFGISAFVAHEDIHPSREWQIEIENALASMDGLAALMTADFHESEWTDQEVGFAVARSVPIVAVQLGLTPYGFLGKYQGLSSSWAKAAGDIVGVLLKSERMFATYVNALRACPSWTHGNTLGAPLKAIEGLTSEQIDALVAAYNETSELRGSFAFNGGKPNYYGPGLVEHLNILGSRRFEFDSEYLIQQAK